MAKQAQKRKEVDAAIKKYVWPEEAVKTNKKPIKLESFSSGIHSALCVLFEDGTWTTSLDSGIDGDFSGVVGGYNIWAYQAVHGLFLLGLISEEAKVAWREWFHEQERKNSLATEEETLKERADRLGYKLTKKGRKSK